ncbi:MAG TPA: heme-binding protein [Burkholderiales bacterium]|nr:heme-binding protein [Burkholderiales bacterium]
MNTSRMVVSAAALALAVAPALAQQQKTTISLDTAKKMAAACEAMAKKEGWNMITAIMDDGGNLKYLSRMDNAFLGSIQIAQLKANTSASFPFSTRQVGDIAQKYVPGIVYVPGVVTFAGGLPIVTANGQHLGSIGVSGASADQDEQCAQAALDAVKGDLSLK